MRRLRDARATSALRGAAAIMAACALLAACAVGPDYSKPAPPVSLHQLISLGIVPQRQQILVVKSGVSHRPAYDPFAARTIEADTPGITAADPRRFAYERVRRPIWPLDEIE